MASGKRLQQFLSRNCVASQEESTGEPSLELAWLQVDESTWWGQIQAFILRSASLCLLACMTMCAVALHHAGVSQRRARDP